MTDAVDLDAARAEHLGDSRLLSVESALRQALADAGEYGWTKCCLVFYRPSGEGQFMTDVRIAGCSTLEARGLMLSEIREEFFDHDG